jgi:signal transduction histidine kinase
MKFINFVTGFNIKKEAEELGIPVWKSPSFLFILMGLFIIIAITIVFFISRSYDSPEILIASESAIVAVVLSVGNIIIKSVEQIARANKMKSEFVTIASHQLKTPLSEVNWELEILLSKNKAGLNDKQLEIIHTIEKSHQIMLRLVNDLLDVARIDQGRFVLSKEKISLSGLVDEAVENNMISARASNVEISVEKSDALPEIIGDKRRIGIVIDNLVSNAIKYIQEKGFVKIKVDSDENNVNVYVKDNGIGIPEKEQSKIFQKFFRSDNAAKYQTGGTGLGLYISKNIVEQSGGKMSFKSIEGVGTDFWFSLPINNNI